MKRKVSVIIPNFNRETLIGHTIENMLKQSLPPYEVIVVDDGSTDDSLKIVQSFGPKVKIIVQSNKGPGAARNAGLDMATGDYVQLMDSDDLASLNKLEVQSELLQTHGADIAFSPWVKGYIDKSAFIPENHVLQQHLCFSGVSLKNRWLRGWSTVFQSLLFRRDFLNRAGRYRTDLLPSEDSEYFFRMLMLEPQTVFSNKCLTLYRLHSLNKISQNEGCSQDRRVLDWARYLTLVGKISKGNPRPDAKTRWYWETEIHRHLGHLKNLPKNSDDSGNLVESLEHLLILPVPFLKAGLLWRRLEEGLRHKISGSRWSPFYHAGPVTPTQRELIRDLGFRINPSSDRP